MLRVNGYDIRNAIRRWLDRSQRSETKFRDSLWSFDKEVKQGVVNEPANKFWEANIAVVKLELLQQKYNHTTTVKIDNKDMSLAEAVMLQGPSGRMEKLWKFAATDTGEDRSYRSRSLTRNKDEVSAQRTLDEETAAGHCETSAIFAAHVRRAVAVGNNSEIEVTDNDLERYLTL